MSEQTDNFSGLPHDFRSVLRPVIESVLMEQPEDIAAFAADFLEDQVKLRDQEWCASGEMNVHGSPVRIKTPSPTKGSPEPIEIQPDILIFEKNVKSSPVSKRLVHTEAVFSPENVDSSSICRKTASDSTGRGRNKHRMEESFESTNTSHRIANNDPHSDQLNCRSKQEFGYAKGPACKSNQSVEARELSKDSILEFTGSGRSESYEPPSTEIADTFFNELLRNNQNLSSNADMLYEVSIETKSELSNEYSEGNGNTANILNENENLSRFDALSLCFDSQQYLPSFEDEQYFQPRDHFNSQFSDEIKPHFEQSQEKRMVFGKKILSAQGVEKISISSDDSPSELLQLHNLDMEFAPRVSVCHEGIADEEKNKPYCEQLPTVGSPKRTISTTSCQLIQTENTIPEKSLHYPYDVLDEVIKKLDLVQVKNDEGNMKDQSVGFKDHNIDELVTLSEDIIVPVSEENNDTFQYISVFANQEDECDSSASDFRCLNTVDEEFCSPLSNDSSTSKSRTISWEASHVQRCNNWMSRNRGPFNPFQRYGKFGDQGKLPHQYSSKTYEREYCCFGQEEFSGTHPLIYLNSVNACCMKHGKRTGKGKGKFENLRSETTGQDFIFYPPPDDVDFIDFSSSVEEINEKENKNRPTITKSQEPLKLSRVIFSSDEIESCEKTEGKRSDGDETIMLRAATGEMEPKPSWKNSHFTYAFQNMPFCRKDNNFVRSISIKCDSEKSHYNQESDFVTIQESSHENSIRQSKSLTDVSIDEEEFSEVEDSCKDLSESCSKQSTDQKIMQSHQEEGPNLDNEICNDKNSDIEQLVSIEESTNVGSNESKIEENNASTGIQGIRTEGNETTEQLVEVEECDSSESKRNASSTENIVRQMQPKEKSSESVTENSQENPEKKYQVESGDYDEDYVIIEDFINQKDCKEGTDSSTEPDRATSDERASFDSADSGEGINAFDDTTSKTLPKNLDSQEKMLVGEGGDMPENGIGKHITELMDRLSDPTLVLNLRESGTQIGKRSSDSVLSVKNGSGSESTSNDDVNTGTSVSEMSSDDNCLLNTQLELSAIMEIFKEQAIESKAKVNESNGQASDSDQLSVAAVSDTGEANTTPETTCETTDIDNNNNTCDIAKTGTTSCEEKTAKEKDIFNSSGEGLRNTKCEDNPHSYDNGYTLTNFSSDHGDPSNASSETETEQLSDTIWPFRDIFKPGKNPSLSPGASSHRGNCKWCQSPSSSSECLPTIHNDHNEQQKENDGDCDITNETTENQSFASSETEMNPDFDKEAKPEWQSENEAKPTNLETESGASIELLSAGETKDQVTKDSITESSENRQAMEGDCRYAQFVNLESLIVDYNSGSLSSLAECQTTLGENEPKSENTGKGKQE